MLQISGVDINMDPQVETKDKKHTPLLEVGAVESLRIGRRLPSSPIMTPTCSRHTKTPDIPAVHQDMPAVHHKARLKMK